MSDTPTLPGTTDEPTNTTRTLEEAAEAGYLGSVYDAKPNEDYTVAGVTAAGDGGGNGGAESSKSTKSSKSS